MACGLFVVVMRMNRAPKDDPRLSRGLQLLQSKISVLEDLSDRTEAQVNQLTAILESKTREVQAKVQLAEQQVHEIRVSMDRSLEVAKIFQDKIPHKEIIERQNTIKYVQAARMAHKGSSVEEIATAVDLPKGEVEFIASVNRDRLMFDETGLPEWANTEVTKAQAEAAGVNFGGGLSVATPETQEEQTSRLRAEIELAENQRLVENLSRLQNEMQNLDHQLVRENAGRNFSAAFEVPKVETETLKKLGEEFRKAVKEGEVADAKQPFLPPLETLSALIPNFIEAGTEYEEPAAKAYVPQPIMPAPIANTLSEALKTPVGAPSSESKIQMALRSTAKPQSSAKSLSPELEAARALAREVDPAVPIGSAGKAAVAPKAASASSTAASAAPKAAPKAAKDEVRKVVFPRIDGNNA